MKLEVHQGSAGARHLMERVLRGGEPIEAEYPLVFRAGAPGRSIALESDGGVRSACTMLMRKLATPRGSLRAGFIGSVVTDPEYQGQGLASRLLAAAEAELARNGAWISLLWADHEEFYQSRGYRPVGAEHDFVIPLEVVADLPAPTHVRERRAGDEEAIHALYMRHPERVERRPEETQALLGSPGMDVLVHERWGRIAGYSCLGRGKDFTDVIHEWAGDALTVLALARAHIERRGIRGIARDVFIIAPPSARDLAARLESLGAPGVQGILGLAKVLDAAACAQFCARLLDTKGRVQVADPASHGDTFHFSGPKGTHELRAEELLDLLMPPKQDKSVLDACTKALGVKGDALPLAPFVWGLDSI